MAKNWLVLLGYLHRFVIFSFQGHFKMLADYHSTYSWHDLKALQDLRAAKEKVLRDKTEEWTCVWGGEGQWGANNAYFVVLFYFWGGGVCVKSAAYLIPYSLQHPDHGQLHCPDLSLRTQSLNEGRRRAGER